MHIETARSQHAWDSFLLSQPFRPFLQSWTMGEVFRDTGQEPVRLLVSDGSAILGICQAVVVPARRGRHLAVPYGPIVSDQWQGRKVPRGGPRPLYGAVSGKHVLKDIMEVLRDCASDHRCSFIRISPFLPLEEEGRWKEAASVRTVSSPLHLLGEHIWYLPLVQPDQWSFEPRALSFEQKHFATGLTAHSSQLTAVPEEELLRNMRKTTRNLIRRAEREGVTVTASDDPIRDLPIFLALHEETRTRHSFTPYPRSFFTSQVRHFAPRGECTLYLAEYHGEVLATSIHMHIGGETSYHHGASTQAHPKVPASTLLQWTAIRDALRRGDHVYSFWGVAPVVLTATSYQLTAQRHPFSGVTLFKTGFGGTLLNLMHCIDVPLTGRYHLTRAFEHVRKWQRGF